jgi:enoyl-[acyl-carrier protein] reductase/trans-2-enoyl-CoA reductase (NAD+)
MHPTTGVLHRSVLKPIGGTFTNKPTPGKVSEISIEPSSGDDIANTL